MVWKIWIGVTRNGKPLMGKAVVDLACIEGRLSHKELVYGSQLKHRVRAELLGPLVSGQPWVICTPIQVKRYKRYYGKIRKGWPRKGEY